MLSSYVHGRQSKCLMVSMLAVVLGGCAVLEDYIHLQQPDARIARVGFQSIDLQSVTILFDVEVENPYSVPLPLVNLDYSLSSRDQQFLTGASELAGSVPAAGKKTIPLPAKITYASLINTLMNVRPGAVVPYTAELGLSVDAPALGRVRLPLVKDGEFPVPTVPEVKVSEIRWETLALNEAAGRVKLDLVNRNEFPIDLSRLTYGLSLGGVEVARSAVTKTVSFDGGGGQGTIEIPISFSPVSLGMGLFRMLSSDESGYAFTGNLSVKTPFGAMVFPIEKTGSTVLVR